MPKLKKFKVWTHVDSGVSVEVEAYDEQEATDKAKTAVENMPAKEFQRQLLANVQTGESNVV